MWAKKRLVRAWADGWRPGNQALAQEALHLGPVLWPEACPASLSQRVGGSVWGNHECVVPHCWVGSSSLGIPPSCLDSQMQLEWCPYAWPILWPRVKYSMKYILPSVCSAEDFQLSKPLCDEYCKLMSSFVCYIRLTFVMCLCTALISCLVRNKWLESGPYSHTSLQQLFAI